MDDKIIKEVILKEKKAERSVKAKSAALERSFKKEQERLEKQKAEEISKLKSSNEAEKKKLVDSLDKEFEAKENKNRKIIEYYDKITDSQIDMTIKSVLRVLE